MSRLLSLIKCDRSQSVIDNEDTLDCDRRITNSPIIRIHARPYIRMIQRDTVTAGIAFLSRKLARLLSQLLRIQYHIK